jgi:hypothetical protein
MNPPLPPAAATRAAIEAVVSAIEACPAAVRLRDEAALIIRGAQARGIQAPHVPQKSDLAAAEHAALRACASAAVEVMLSDPSLVHLITVAELGLYILRQATVIALGSDGSAVTLVLRDPHLN